MHFVHFLCRMFLNYLKYTKLLLNIPFFHYEIIISTFNCCRWQNIINFNLFPSLMTNSYFIWRVRTIYFIMIFLPFLFVSSLYKSLTCIKIQSINNGEDFFPFYSFFSSFKIWRESPCFTRLKWCFLINDWYNVDTCHQWSHLVGLVIFFITQILLRWMKYDFVKP